MLIGTSLSIFSRAETGGLSLSVRFEQSVPPPSSWPDPQADGSRVRVYIIRIVAWGLSGKDLHIWRIALERDEAEVRSLRPLLSQTELDRAARFRFEKDRRHYLAAHTILRKLLLEYLQWQPAPFDFQYGTEGKPCIPTSELRFNLSHSGEVALAAFTLSHELGVDVERIREGVNDEGIAQRFFSSSEAAALLALPEDQRDRAFFRIWTRKEAYVKARGGGLTIPLDSFDVSVHPDKAELLRASDRNRWTMFHLEAGPGYCAAAVTEAGVDSVRMFSA